MEGGKAGNLIILSRIKGIKVPKFIVLYPHMLDAKREELVHCFLSLLSHGSTVAVRSSGQEDTANASFAGMYQTKLYVEPKFADVLLAVNEVVSSATAKPEVVAHYAAERKIRIDDAKMSVIIQEMVNPELSGVIFSHEPKGVDGYYLISVSPGVGEHIVGGKSSGKLVRVARGADLSCIKDEWLRKVVEAMEIIERHYRSKSLDVEFAFSDGTLYILQCRPLVTEDTVQDREVKEKRLLCRLNSLNSSIASSFHGDVLGDMIDINPRELLGSAPTPLDISIFNCLFADKIVEQVRRGMGYDPLDVGLIRVVEGKPYASLRATAFSFRPKGISDEIYGRMVDVYREALIKNPAIQSSVEFDLYAMSCGEKLEQVMEEAGLGDDDKRIVREAFGRIDDAFVKLSAFQSESIKDTAHAYELQTDSLVDASLTDILKHVATGTEIFVRVARLAFYWKNKFEEKYPNKDLNKLLTGHIHTIGGQLQNDLNACRRGTITREDLLRRYGHLRPGQFSVFGESYADDPDTYLFSHMESGTTLAEPEKQDHVFADEIAFKNIITFMEARELMKFLFTRSLHLFATQLKRVLSKRAILESDASRMSWSELQACLCDSSDFVTQSSEDFSVLLPEILVPGMTDLQVITFTEAMPSYITTAVVKARLCVLEQPNAKVDVKGALVLLPNSDPGYDFLFHSGALGIITKVGGPASHMCLRSIELQMPACIGCGENTYQMLISAKTAVLDCSSQQIVVFD